MSGSHLIQHQRPRADLFVPDSPDRLGRTPNLTALCHHAQPKIQTVAADRFIAEGLPLGENPRGALQVVSDRRRGLQGVLDCLAESAGGQSDPPQQGQGRGRLGMTGTEDGPLPGQRRGGKIPRPNELALVKLQLGQLVEKGDHPGMVGAEGFQTNGSGPLQKLLGLRVLAPRQRLETGQQLRMVAPVQTLLLKNGFLQVALRPVVVVHLEVGVPDVGRPVSCGRMVWIQGSRAYPARFLYHVKRVRVIPQLQELDPQVVQTGADLGVIRVERLQANGQCLPIRLDPSGKISGVFQRNRQRRKALGQIRMVGWKCLLANVFGAYRIFLGSGVVSHFPAQGGQTQESPADVAA